LHCRPSLDFIDNNQVPKDYTTALQMIKDRDFERYLRPALAIS
jgi:hypothetical protein